MYDGGSFFCDSNSSIGNSTLPGEFKLRSLHVQYDGTIELHSFNKNLNTHLSVTNLTVSLEIVNILL